MEIHGTNLVPIKVLMAIGANKNFRVNDLDGEEGNLHVDIHADYDRGINRSMSPPSATIGSRGVVELGVDTAPFVNRPQRQGLQISVVSRIL